MIKGAIFDLDGTILDSMAIWDTIGEEYLRSLGIEPRENLSEVFKTFTLEESAKYYQTHYGVTLSVDKIVNGVNKMVEDYYKNKVTLKKGVEKLFARLAKDGVKMCVATVTDKYLVEAALSRLNVRHYFEEIFTTAEVGCNKQDPKIYRTALAHLKTKKHETFVFEDALHALLTAKKDGFIVVGVYDEHESRQIEMKANSDYYITSFESIQI